MQDEEQTEEEPGTSEAPVSDATPSEGGDEAKSDREEGGPTANESGGETEGSGQGTKPSEFESHE